MADDRYTPRPEHKSGFGLWTVGNRGRDPYGAFAANDPRVRAYAVQKTCRAMDLGAELGAEVFVLWGGREGAETDARRRPDEAIKRLRGAASLALAGEFGPALTT